jgi:DNA-binding transcriptional MocR family regulator
VRELARRLEAADHALARELPEGSSVAPVEGGFLLWITLPAPLDSAALLADAKRAGVVYAPGELFHPDGRGSACLRISVAHTPLPELERGIRVLGEVVRAALPRGRGKARGARAAEAVHV